MSSPCIEKTATPSARLGLPSPDVGGGLDMHRNLPALPHVAAADPRPGMPVISLVDGKKNLGGWMGVFAHIWLLNPVTPIVVIFQRAIYTPHNNKATGAPLLPNWPYSTYVAYLGLSFALGLIFLVLAVWVFGRSEQNFAEEL